MTDPKPLASLTFLDTETTGVHPDRRPWEIAMIRRDYVLSDPTSWTERTVLLQVDDVDLRNADPFGLKVGGFYERHGRYRPDGRWVPAGPDDSPEWPNTLRDGHLHTAADDPTWFVTERQAAALVEQLTRGAHLVGVVPSFDAECLDRMLRRHRLIPAWHYHLVDVEAMAAGYLAARPPWSSDALSRLCGEDPPAEDQRHTALGDADWAKRWYDRLTGPCGASA